MSNIASITLSGRLTADPESTTVGKDKHDVTKFRLAVTQYRGKNREPDAGFYSCEAWGPVQQLLQYVSKGDQLTVVGQVVQDEVEKDGETKVYWNIRVNEIALPPKGSSEGGSSKGSSSKKKTSRKKKQEDDDDDWG